MPAPFTKEQRAEIWATWKRCRSFEEAARAMPFRCSRSGVAKIVKAERERRALRPLRDVWREQPKLPRAVSAKVVSRARLATLQEAARARKVKPFVLLRDIINAALDDDMINAILDDGVRS